MNCTRSADEGDRRIVPLSSRTRIAANVTLSVEGLACVELRLAFGIELYIIDSVRIIWGIFIQLISDSSKS